MKSIIAICKNLEPPLQELMPLFPSSPLPKKISSTFPPPSIISEMWLPSPSPLLRIPFSSSLVYHRNYHPKYKPTCSDTRPRKGRSRFLWISWWVKASHPNEGVLDTCSTKNLLTFKYQHSFSLEWILER